jgi:hypothetical protein
LFFYRYSPCCSLDKDSDTKGIIAIFKFYEIWVMKSDELR